MSISLAPRIVAGVNLDELVDAFLRADTDILEIVLFGSAAYAPELARDIDLLVLTRHKKEIDVDWDAALELGLPLDVDVILKEPGEKWGEDIALSVAAVGISLYGSQLAWEEAKKNMGVPTFDDARMMVHVAAEVLALAENARDPFRRDIFYKDAFNKLFDAARFAAMMFLHTDNNRWGQVKAQLPESFRARFKELIDTLHVLYHYDGNYPRQETAQEFAKWRPIVNQFIDDLETESLAQQKKSETGE